MTYAEFFDCLLGLGLVSFLFALFFACSMRSVSVQVREGRKEMLEMVDREFPELSQAEREELKAELLAGYNSALPEWVKS